MNQEDVEMLPTLEEHAIELKDLCLRFGVSRLELFGSATTGKFQEGESALDFLVDFLPAAVANHADNYFGLLEELEELLGKPVDLVVESAIKNPFFRQSVEDTKSLIYTA